MTPLWSRRRRRAIDTAIDAADAALGEAADQPPPPNNVITFPTRAARPLTRDDCARLEVQVNPDIADLIRGYRDRGLSATELVRRAIGVYDFLDRSTADGARDLALIDRRGGVTLVRYDYAAPDSPPRNPARPDNTEQE